MNKILLLLPLLFFSMLLNAQRIEKKKMKFSYVQFPTTPVKGVTNYNSTVVIGYQNKISSMKAAFAEEQVRVDQEHQANMLAYEAEKKKADEEYQAALNNYKMEVAKEEAEYQKAMEAYNKAVNDHNKTNNSGTVTKGGSNGNGTVTKGGNPANGTVTKGGNSGTGTVTKGGNSANGTVTKGGTNPAGTVTKDDGGNKVVAIDSSSNSSSDCNAEPPKRRYIPEPLQRVVRVPEKRTISEPHYPKLYEAKELSDTYVTLEGMSRDANNALQLIVTLKGFESTSPSIKEAKNTSKDKDGNPVVTYSYTGAVQYKHAIHIQVITPMGQTLMDEVLEDKMLTKKTSAFSSRVAVEQYLNQGDFYDKLEDETIKKNLIGLQKNINNRFGFPIKSRSTQVRMYTHRKMNYPEYKTAYEAVAEAYPQLVDLNKKAVVVPALNKAIKAWEGALKESKPDDNKARINKKVTRYTHLMLAEAYMWMDDFQKAAEHLSKMNPLKPIGKEKKWKEKLEKLLASQKQRITAYNNAQ